MAADRPLRNTKPRNRQNRVTMPSSKWNTDSACDSDALELDPFADPPTSDLIVPSPVTQLTLSDAEDDASPSQYRKEMEKKECRGQSDDEDGEEENGEEEEYQEEAAASEQVKTNRPELSIWLANSPQWWTTREKRS
jgi:hypothetical protein